MRVCSIVPPQLFLHRSRWIQIFRSRNEDDLNFNGNFICFFFRSTIIGEWPPSRRLIECTIGQLLSCGKNTHTHITNIDLPDCSIPQIVRHLFFFCILNKIRKLLICYCHSNCKEAQPTIRALPYSSFKIILSRHPFIGSKYENSMLDVYWQNMAANCISIVSFFFFLRKLSVSMIRNHAPFFNRLFKIKFIKI